MAQFGALRLEIPKVVCGWLDFDGNPFADPDSVALQAHYFPGVVGDEPDIG